ncbi:hypothetical protein [Haloarcula salinisoli]|uniref:Uncharacterized protein n=1 Tax=Haloarcula salinisoli TaxID=2487746 RepID=A0A8J7YJM2_9EURY|nr:hypothetical protein [Halomicroarcula salinisoli]MBX0287875.1 hypothetical protein [Halomicroarcula salinisoli]MBX0304818.1 hypothetical protein [Halomicroarcula salinisoli]
MEDNTTPNQDGVGSTDDDAAKHSHSRRALLASGEMDDTAILSALDYWQDGETVPGTDGETIDDQTQLDPVGSWQDGGSE